MDIYKKINNIYVSRLKNAEYTTFFKRIVSLFGEVEIALFGIAAIINRLLECITVMTDLVNRSTASRLTSAINEADNKRNSLVNYVLSAIRNAKNSPIEGIQSAYQTLEVVIRPYSGITSMPGMDETAAIDGLLLDLRKNENYSAVKYLGLIDILTELETANKHYSDLNAQRVQERIDNLMDNSKQIREEMDALYDKLIMHVTATNLTAGTEQTSNIIDSINQIIAETKFSHNQRTAKNVSTTSEKEENTQSELDNK